MAYDLEKMKEIAEKIKNNEATPEETEEFFKSLDEVLDELGKEYDETQSE